MLKKIRVSDVRAGMFVHEICGSWMEHPFWKKAFLLEENEDLKALKTCGVQEVWIDTDKGLDVGSDAVLATPTEVEKDIEEELGKVASEPLHEARIPLHDEIERARKLQAKSKAAVTSMFQEVRMGN